MNGCLRAPHTQSSHARIQRGKDEVTSLLVKATHAGGFLPNSCYYSNRGQLRFWVCKRKAFEIYRFRHKYMIARLKPAVKSRDSTSARRGVLEWWSQQSFIAQPRLPMCLLLFSHSTSAKSLAWPCLQLQRTERPAESEKVEQNSTEHI